MPDCPVCKTKLAADAKECPRCGWDLKKSDKFNCPFCGELIPIRSRKCQKCDFSLTGLPAKARFLPTEKVREVLMSDLLDIDSSEAEAKEKKFICPVCSQILDGSEAKCPKCGQFLMGESGYRCPKCSTLVGMKRKTCPKCKASLEKVRREAIPMVRYAPEPTVKPSTELEEPADSRTCPTCGTRISKELRSCPVCNTSFSSEPPGPELPEIKEEAPTKPEVRIEEAVIAPQPEPTPLPAKPRMVRKLKPPPQVHVSAKAKQRSLKKPKGEPHAGAHGMVNGTGATNGKAFADGTGISNGLGPRPRPSSAERAALLTKWQFLAILVVIIIVVPAFVYLLYYRDTDGFNVDGSFSEWDGATVYGTMIQSSAASSNIIEWAVATETSDLYLYFRTEESMMSTPEPESYYLFVDSDGSAATGYVMGSLGADYMLQLSGWDGDVGSTALSQYSSSSSDQLDWNAWTSVDSLIFSKEGSRIEVKASLPGTVSDSAKFMLLSKDSMERGSVSYSAPLRGAVLIVEQSPTEEVASDGLVPMSASVEVLRLKFTSEGGSGIVEQVSPELAGASLAAQVPSFSLGAGESADVTIAVDTSAMPDGEFVSARVMASNIVSSYASVEIVGPGAYAYVGSPPASVVIDGAFADWTAPLSVDSDATSVASNLNIGKVGNVSTYSDSFFYVSVLGEMCSGTFVPAFVTIPATGGGGGTIVTVRHTAEDVLRIYVDSDNLDSTGAAISLGSMEIGADKKIEVRGLFGFITSTKMFGYSAGSWVETAEPVSAAKDYSRLEVGVSAASIGGSSNVDFIIETTSWKGSVEDQAFFDSSSLTVGTRTWVVDPLLSNPYATSMSYQRKMFYDGTNHWSLYFDGSDTVYRYSTDNGQTWTHGGRVFSTPGVNETSIWYDSSASTVYAVGDTSTASTDVYVQTGRVDAAAHAISWAASDSSLTTSTYAAAGKNTYISKDLNGYLWVLSSNLTSNKFVRFQINAFRSTGVDSASSWFDTGQLLPWAADRDNVKGSILPAGSGSDMWAILAFQGTVMAAKYEGTWVTEIAIYGPAGSTANTDNSPPSAVVDSKGVVHVVYGTGRKTAQTSIPQVFYSRNDTALTFTTGLNLDPANDTLGVGNHYPTISLETSTDNLYVFWLQCDSTQTPRTVMGRKCVSGTWTSVDVGPQTTFAKYHMTSVYSVSGEYNVCWQWAQNRTAPFQVMFDSLWVPEFGELAPIVIASIVVFAACRTNSRRRGDLAK